MNKTSKARRLAPRRVTAAIAKQSWDEDAFFEYAAKHRPPAEVALLHALVDHAVATGGRQIWRRGGLPGASVWYPVAGELTAMYGFSAGDASTSGHVLLYLDGLPALLTSDHLARIQARVQHAGDGQEPWATRIFELEELTAVRDSVPSILTLITEIIDRPTPR